MRPSITGREPHELPPEVPPYRGLPRRVYASSPYISTNQLSTAWVLGESRTTPRGYGFYRSDDGARTWQRLSDESPTEIAQIPGDTRIVGLFGKQHVKVSDDGGETWTPFEDGLFIRSSPPTDSVSGGAYYALAAGRDFWLVGDGNGAKYRRGRTAASWIPLPNGTLAPGDPANEQRLASFSPSEIRMTALSTLVTDPRDDGHWLATDWFELWETFDAGTNWTSRMRGIMPLVSYDIAFDPNSSDNFFWCLYDVGAVATRDGGRTFVPGRFLCGGGDRTVQESTDGGRTWHAYTPLQGRKCGGIAFDRHESGSVVFACRDGLYHSADGGATMRLLENGLQLPSGTSRTVALDRGRLFCLTSGSGIWGMTLTALRMAPGLPRPGLHYGIVPVLLKNPDRLVTAIAAHQASAANGGDLVVVDYEGRDFADHVVAVAGLVAGEPASLSFAALDGAGGATLTASADANGFAVFDIPVAPGTNFTYTVIQAGETLYTGALRAGGWDAAGSWFRAEPDGHGGSTEIGGAWTVPPVETNAASYYAGITSEFALSAETRAAGGDRLVRAETAISYVGMRSLASLADLPRGGSLAAVTVVETREGGPTAWAACVGGVWRTMHGAAPPMADVDYRIRMEGDFSLANPRVRLSVSADGGRTYETLLAPDGAEWFAPNDPERRELSSLAADGGAEIGGFRGELANVFVAEVGGVGYASLSEALRAAGSGGTVTLLTDATAPLSLARGCTIVGNGYDLDIYDDTITTLIILK